MRDLPFSLAGRHARRRGLRDARTANCWGAGKTAELVFFLAICSIPASEKNYGYGRALPLNLFGKRSEELRRDYDEALPELTAMLLDAWTAERKTILGKQKTDKSIRAPRQSPGSGP